MKRLFLCLCLANVSFLANAEEKACEKQSQETIQHARRLANAEYQTQLDTYNEQVKRASEQQEASDRQLKKSEEQLNISSEHLRVSGEQQRRMDALIERWEKQADRYDALLDKWEKQKNTKEK